MTQTALTILFPLSSKRVAQKRAELEALRLHSHAAQNEGHDDSPARSQLRALVAHGIHYLSFFIVDPGEGEYGGCSAYVVLEVTCDGSASAMRKRLASEAADFVKVLLDSADAPPEKLPRLLRKYSCGSHAVYEAFPGHSVEQIRLEQMVRERARTYRTLVTGPATGGGCPHAGGQTLSPTSASAAWQEIRRVLDQKLSFAGREIPARDFVTQGQTRPWLVRWSPNGRRFCDRANLWARRLGTVLFVLAAAAGAFLVGRAGLWAIGLCAALVAPHVGLTALAWYRESPKRLKGPGFRAVLGRAALDLAMQLLFAAAVVCAGAVAVVAASRLSANTLLWSALAGIVCAGGVVRAGLTDVAKFGVGLAVVLTALVPASSWPVIAPCLVALGGAIPVGAVALFFYLLDGAVGAVFEGGLVAALWSCVVAYVWQAAHSGRTDPLLAWIPVVGLVVVIAVAAARVAWWLYALRGLEAEEPAGPLFWDLEHLARVQSTEDHTLQNHLAHVANIKQDRGGLRLRTLQRVLRGVNLLARTFFTQGDLATIQTIHFARFMILPDKKRLLFMGNYDGGFGSYLHEFNSVGGVTAVWSNCVGFPRAFYLVGDGASDEQRFKAFGRRYQVPTLGWFSAYTHLAVCDIEAATSTREALRRELDDPSTLRGRMRARFGEPLTEADCDAALRAL
jgi:hypothetical protein